MIYSGEVLKKFNLKKGQLDNLIKRYKRELNLSKDGAGRYLWPQEAVDKLREITRDTTREEETTKSQPAITRATDHATEAREIALTIAAALGEKLEVYQEKIVSLEKKIVDLERGQRRQVQEIKENQTESLAQFDQKFTVTLEQRERASQRALDEKEKEITTLTTRMDRRKEPSTLIGRVLKKVFLEPVLLTDRRSKSVN